MTIGDASLPEEEFSEMYGAGNPDGGMDMHRTEDSPEGMPILNLFSSCLLSVMCRRLWLQLRQWKTGLHFLKRQAFLFERIAVFRERASCFRFPIIRFRREENGWHPFRQITY